VLIYNLGFTVVHVAMFAASFMIQSPDAAEGLRLQKEDIERNKALAVFASALKIDDHYLDFCRSNAILFQNMMTFLRVFHFLCIPICMNRELRRTTVNWTGDIMQSLEVILSFTYVLTIIGCLNMYFDGMDYRLSSLPPIENRP